MNVKYAYIKWGQMHKNGKIQHTVLVLLEDLGNRFGQELYKMESQNLICAAIYFSFLLDEDLIHTVFLQSSRKEVFYISFYPL